ncbi:LytTR family DNA-binding domain-containing protein [Fulvivirgaceae bacterium BMA12]|uniref:LytTR family DNA-binding domain-containing protein n=1 Tax=Agaribacillus aureus TaxID=3051825 RepID=A0ABT8L8R7_9BACT|nr:LytTR family DNA-binding domain-containing protein [Fulvivirgaceae bacterium BMA12]
MITCVAIDDEPEALEIIKMHVSKITELDLLGCFFDPETAIDFIEQGSVDLIFLDINLPGFSGIDFLKRLKNQPHVIFTTAYSEYAVESYEFEAVDYLLKPFEFDRFLLAFNKVKKVIALGGSETQDAKKFFFIKDGSKTVRIQFEDILFIQGYGNYLSLTTKKGKNTVRMTFNQLMNQLPPQSFMRVHNSYVVSLQNIHKIEHNYIFFHNQKIPIGAGYKKDFMRKINI